MRANDAEDDTRKVEQMVVVGFGWVRWRRERKREKVRKPNEGKGAKPEVNTRQKDENPFGEKEPQERKTGENPMPGDRRQEFGRREAARRRPESVDRVKSSERERARKRSGDQRASVTGAAALYKDNASQATVLRGFWGCSGKNIVCVVYFIYFNLFFVY